MHDIEEIAANVWNERLKQCMAQGKYSQKQFADALNVARGDDKRDITQKTVSRWMRVGERSKEGTIGFPKYENMLLIAHVLKVDVGYLTGQLEAKSIQVNRICAKLHLRESSVRAIMKVTGTEKSCLLFGCQSRKYRNVLNRMLSSHAFLELMDSMRGLEEHLRKHRAVWKNAEKKWSAAVWKDANIKYYGQIDYEHDCTVPQPEKETIECMQEIDACIDRQYDLDFAIKVARYEVYTSMQRLIDEMFPPI